MRAVDNIDSTKIVQNFIGMECGQRHPNHFKNLDFNIFEMKYFFLFISCQFKCDAVSGSDVGCRLNAFLLKRF